MQFNTRSYALAGLVLAVGMCTACDKAPKEQRDWGARTGTIDLEPKPGSQREREEAELKALEAQQQAKEAASKSANSKESRKNPPLDLTPPKKN